MRAPAVIGEASDSTLRVAGGNVSVLDQTRLPFAVERRVLSSLDEAARAIRTMQVRGAPLIGATAAFGVALHMRTDASDAGLTRALETLAATRPTAVNLAWALARMRQALADLPTAQRAETAWSLAESLAREDIACNRLIGEHGLALLRALPQRGPQALNVLTHCNAGRLATVDHGTALAPIYAAHAAGLAIHVYVSETRPRNQGLLTAWELRGAGISHTLIADNAAGHLLARRCIDAVIVGADRIASNGDTANKVGTLLKALAASDRGVPFYVAAPVSTIDFECPSGERIPIEERGGEEVRRLTGLDARGAIASIDIAGADVPVANPAFDVTPARLVTRIITERGVHVPREIAGLGAKR